MDWEIKVSDHHRHVIRSERGGTRIAEADANLSEDEATLIISRLVKCWNACAGMADPAAEIEALRAKLDEAVQEMCQIKPYLNWTVSDESPGYHPTMPSAVVRFNAALARIKGE
jgi:hypothetical protein